ncbi:MAG TPA: M3 family metallopeptidase, partial [Xanthomonadales bacterium]|nr:M3 family metallopeptidase [Xanthomonadales bacterium]
MNDTNPLLATDPLPRFSAVEPAHVEPAIDQLLAASRARIDELLATQGPRDWASVMQPQEELDDALSRAFAPVSHLHSVKDSPALRDAYGEALEKITEFETDVGQNRGLYEAVKAVRDAASFAQLSRAQRTIVDDALLGFRLSGVALDEAGRARFKAIATELSRLSTEFEQAVLDATDAWHRDLPETALAGVPESGLAPMRAAADEARAKGGDGAPAHDLVRVTLKQPSYVAVMTYANDRQLRHDVYEAYATRASDQGPHAGKYDNTPRIERILALRHEAALLLDFPNAAAESLVTKMAGTPERVVAFLKDLAARARPVAERELQELRDFARGELGIADLQPWDVAWASEKMRQARYQLSEEELKPYFPLDRALDGLFAVTKAIFGITFRPADADTWHPDVRYYEVVDADGNAFAGAYLDMFARTAKRGGAWMDVCRSRFRQDQGLQKPVAFLTCNFAPPTAELPSLLTHDDVITLFHEFGHGLHHLLTEVDFPSASGISGVEWDAVELPSQFMENFCWKREALDLIARHWQTNEPLPEDLWQRMQAARYFQAGLFLVRQLEFALFDFRLHLEYDPARGARMLELLESVRKEVAVIVPPSWHRFPTSFTHIFSGGYGAGYYSYLWAEVLSADAFSRF